MKKLLLNLAAMSSRWLPISVKRSLYAFKPAARLIRASLNKAAPQGLTQVRVAAGNLAGVSLCLDLQTEKDYWLGTYEIELQQTIQDLVKPGMVVYDVGANIGYISLMLARQVSKTGKIFSFEALPENQERFLLNLTTSGFGDWVQLVKAAVVDKTGTVQFQIGPSGGMGKAAGSAGRQEYSYTKSIEVQAICLDDFVFEQRNPAPRVVKMDIEGGEVLALPGMSRVLEQVKPVMMLELHGPEAASVAWQILKKAGYRICQMQPTYPQVDSLDGLDWKAYLLAFPEV
jgi:FkbM family methyltransferase